MSVRSNRSHSSFDARELRRQSVPYSYSTPGARPISFRPGDIPRPPVSPVTPPARPVYIEEEEYRGSEESQGSFPSPQKPGIGIGIATSTNEGLGEREKSRWPEEGEQALPGLGQRAIDFALDVFMLLFAVFFVIVAVMVVALNGTVAPSRLGEDVRNILLVSPSIYPIVFAAILARCLRAFGHYKAEHGIKLANLEMLIGSTSVASVLSTNLTVRRVNFLSIGLIILWLFSPVGGQALLRLLTTRQTFQISPAEIFYLDTTQGSIYSRLAEGRIGITIPNQEIQNPFIIFNSLLLNSQNEQGESQDAWSNLKIPVLESLGGQADAEGWKLVEGNETEYSSLLGVPVLGVEDKDNGTTTFTMRSTYFRFECKEMSKIEWRRVFNETSRVENPDPIDDGTIATPLGVIYGNNISEATSRASFFIDTTTQGRLQDTVYLDSGSTKLADYGMFGIPRGMKETTIEPRQITFGSLYVPGSSTVFTRNTEVWDVAFASLEATQSFVESQVICHRLACKIEKMRPIPASETMPSTYTPLEDGSLFRALSRNLQGAGSLRSLDGSMQASYIERYLFNPKTLLSSGPSSDQAELFMPLFNVPKEEFGKRFSVLFNTFYLATVAPYSFTSPLATEASALNASEKFRFSPWANVGKRYGAPVYLSNTSSGTVSTHRFPATFTTPIKRYTFSLPFLALFSSSILVLLVATLLSIYARTQTRSPHIFGYVSALTRNNPYAGDAADGSAIDEDERLRLLVDRWVYVRDVGGSRGRVAVTVGDVGERLVLKRGRTFV